MHLCCIARMRSVPRYSIHCASVTPDGRGVDGSELDARSGAGATFCRMRDIAARAAPSHQPAAAPARDGQLVSAARKVKHAQWAYLYSKVKYKVRLRVLVVY